MIYNTFKSPALQGFFCPSLNNYCIAILGMDKKTAIHNWISQGMAFDTGVELFLKFHNSAYYRKQLSLGLRGQLDCNYKVMKHELCKMVRLNYLEVEKKGFVTIKNKLEFNLSDENRIEFNVSNKKEVLSRKKTARELYPKIDWQCDANIDTCYILIGKQITAYHAYCDFHVKLRNAKSLDDVNKYAQLVIQNVIENRLCIDELQEYNDNGVFKKKHTYFHQIDLETEIKKMSVKQLAKELSLVNNYISRYSSYIKKDPDNKNVENWKEYIKEYSLKKELINKYLDVV